jgi:hypothetical protein
MKKRLDDVGRMFLIIGVMTTFLAYEPHPDIWHAITFFGVAAICAIATGAIDGWNQGRDEARSNWLKRWRGDAS